MYPGSVAEEEPRARIKEESDNGKLPVQRSAEQNGRRRCAETARWEAGSLGGPLAAIHRGRRRLSSAR